VDLHRPLVLPVVQAGQSCPVTVVRHTPDPRLGVVQGSGVAGPVGLGVDVDLAYDAPAVGSVWADRSWGGQKVMWAVDGAELGSVLVRGRQLDGPHTLAFDSGADPELVLDPGQVVPPGGWRDYPSFTRLRAPGCYAYQVDALSGTTVIVFSAMGPTLAG
jgi:hypothetical protein